MDELTKLQQGNRAFVQREYEKAIPLLLEYAAENPDDAASAYVSLAQVYERGGRLPEPEDMDPEIKLSATMRPRMCEYYYRLALAVEPRHITALRNLADCYSDKSDERGELLERAVSIQPGYVSLIDLGDFHRSKRKDFERAYELYFQAQEFSPKVKTAYDRLKDICRRLGRSGRNGRTDAELARQQPGVPTFGCWWHVDR